METKTRSIVKAGLWTLMGLIIMTLIGFMMTGSVGLGGAMALTNSAIGLVTYVIYERVWARIDWGRDA